MVRATGAGSDIDLNAHSDGLLVAIAVGCGRRRQVRAGRLAGGQLDRQHRRRPHRALDRHPRQRRHRRSARTETDTLVTIAGGIALADGAAAPSARPSPTTTSAAASIPPIRTWSTATAPPPTRSPPISTTPTSSAGGDISVVAGYPPSTTPRRRTVRSPRAPRCDLPSEVESRHRQHHRRRLRGQPVRAGRLGLDQRGRPRHHGLHRRHRARSRRPAASWCPRPTTCTWLPSPAALALGQNAAGIGVALQIDKSHVKAYVGARRDRRRAGQRQRRAGAQRHQERQRRAAGHLVKGLAVTATSFEDVITHRRRPGRPARASASPARPASRCSPERQGLHRRERRHQPGHDQRARADQSVFVLASDRTSHVGVAGSVALGGIAGIGAGIDVGVIVKTYRGADRQRRRRARRSATCGAGLLGRGARLGGRGRRAAASLSASPARSTSRCSTSPPRRSSRAARPWRHRLHAAPPWRPAAACRSRPRTRPRSTSSAATSRWAAPPGSAARSRCPSSPRTPTPTSATAPPSTPRPTRTASTSAPAASAPHFGSLRRHRRRPGQPGRYRQRQRHRQLAHADSAPRRRARAQGFKGVAVTAINQRRHRRLRRRRRRRGHRGRADLGDGARDDRRHLRLHRRQRQGQPGRRAARARTSRCWWPPATTTSISAWPAELAIAGVVARDAGRRGEPWSTNDTKAYIGKSAVVEAAQDIEVRAQAARGPAVDLDLGRRLGHRRHRRRRRRWWCSTSRPMPTWTTAPCSTPAATWPSRRPTPPTSTSSPGGRGIGIMRRRHRRRRRRDRAQQGHARLGRPERRHRRARATAAR